MDIDLCVRFPLYALNFSSRVTPVLKLLLPNWLFAFYKQVLVFSDFGHLNSGVYP